MNQPGAAEIAEMKERGNHSVNRGCFIKENKKLIAAETAENMYLNSSQRSQRSLR